MSQFRVCILWRTRPLSVFKGESFRETLLTSSAIVKCDGLAFGAFPGCVTRCFTLKSRFLTTRPAKVTIYATWCQHFLSFFLLFRAVHPSAFVWCCEVIGLQILLWRMQTLNWDTACDCQSLIQSVNVSLWAILRSSSISSSVLRLQTCSAFTFDSVMFRDFFSADPLNDNFLLLTADADKIISQHCNVWTSG